MKAACFWFSLSLFLVTISAEAATLHVPGSYPTIQAALDAAENGDTVQVAAGTYTGPGNKDLDLLGNDIVLWAPDGPGATVIDCEHSGRAIWLQGQTSATRIEGFTFQNGDATEAAFAAGGAILCTAAAVLVSHCNFLGSTATNGLSSGGGAVACYNCQPTFEDCRFEGNSVAGQQAVGGAAAFYMTTAILRNCDFIGNSTTGMYSAGGAVFAWETSNLTLEYCVFEENSTDTEGGGMFLGSLSQGTFNSCMFERNTAYTGGGLYSDTGPTLMHCGFVKNWAQFGGGFDDSPSGVATIDDCHFIDNHAEVQGGAMRIVRSDSQLSGCVFSGNSSPDGGAIIVRGGDQRITGCTFFGNSSPNGSAIAVYPYVISSHVTLENTIIAFGMTGSAIACGGLNVEVTATCSDVFGNEGGDWVQCLTGQSGVAGNFSAAPIFCDPHAGDFRLHTSSPCLPGQHPGGASCGLIGALQEGCGATAVRPTTWGQIKTTFRATHRN